MDLPNEIWYMIISYILYYQISIRRVCQIFNIIHKTKYGAHIETYFSNLRIPLTKQQLLNYLFAVIDKKSYVIK